MMTFISVKMSMNEYLAGITLIAFINTFPDLVSNIRANTTIFTNAVSNCLVDLLLCGGLVCFLKPFKMDGYAVVRDMLFLVLAVELNTTIITSSASVTVLECIGKFGYYMFSILDNFANCIVSVNSSSHILLDLSLHPSN